MGQGRERHEFMNVQELRTGGRVWNKVIGPGLPAAEVYVRFGVEKSGRIVCTGVHIAAADADEEVTATDLRRVPLAGIIDDLSAYITGAAAVGGDLLTKALMRHMAHEAAGKHMAPFTPRARAARLPDEHFRQVAERYRAALRVAPRRPIQHLAGELHVAEPTLRRWVQRARDMGLLGQSIPGKAGERPEDGEARR